MIPKKIHYCWFGGKELPDIAKKCISSWKEYCPDYEVFQWDESNCDLDCMPYVQEAYESKNWAFVSDVIRLLVVYAHGGIYLDIDVEVIKSFDELLVYDSFWGFESKKFVAPGLGFGAVAKSNLLRQLIESYKEMHFILQDGTYNKIPCPHIYTKIFSKIGFQINGKTQRIDNNILLSTEYLCPLDYKTLKCKITPNTFSIHLFNASWLDEKEKENQKKYKKIIQRYGYVCGKIMYLLRYIGLKGSIRIIINKLRM